MTDTTPVKTAKENSGSFSCFFWNGQSNCQNMIFN